MQIKTTLGKIANPEFVEAFRNLSKQRSLGVTNAYKLEKIRMELDKEITIFSQTVRDIQMRHVEKDADGNPVFLNKEKTMFNVLDAQAFQSDMEELQNTEVHFEFDPIKSENLSDISAADVQHLGGLFIESIESVLEKVG